MKKRTNTLENFLHIQREALASDDGQRCMIAPHPKLKEAMKKEMEKLKKGMHKGLANKIKLGEGTRPGMNDGLIYPGDLFPLGTSSGLAKAAKLDKPPLRGVLRVIVVLVDFSDLPMKKTKKHFEDLFFSKGKISTGSVREYFSEVSKNLIDIQGEVVGPFRMPRTLKAYANGASGTGVSFPNARTMAFDAAKLANPSVDFSKYDNDKDNFVDAFVVVHAGTGAETNNDPDGIWSHKWVLPNGAVNADGTTKIFSYLTVPEDCELGVCAHELGHLLFGWPDLYDSDYSSEGIGDWCLMAGGSWNNNGLTPAHPSAWCKCTQGWVTVETPSSNLTKVNIRDIKTDGKVYKLWKNGLPGKEYFLVENRNKVKFDKYLPGAGLLIWHVDDAIEGNSDEAHYRVALKQADGNKDLEKGNNQGDASDCYPGVLKKTSFNSASNPSSKSYAGLDTSVSVTKIAKAGSVISADISVK